MEVKAYSSSTRANLPELEIADLDANYMDYPWSSDQWAEYLSRVEGWRVFWLTGGYHCSAFALFEELDNQKAHLLKIIVMPDERGCGLAKKLLNEAKKHYLEIFLEVRADNHNAIGLYQGLGFESYHRVVAYYSDGQDALKFQYINNNKPRA